MQILFWDEIAGRGAASDEHEDEDLGVELQSGGAFLQNTPTTAKYLAFFRPFSPSEVVSLVNSVAEPPQKLPIPVWGCNLIDHK